MKRSFLAILAAFYPGSIMAHHGLDAFVTLDTQVPEFGHVTAFSSFTWSEMNGVDELALEPGLSHGNWVGNRTRSTVSLCGRGTRRLGLFICLPSPALGGSVRRVSLRFSNLC